MTDNVATTWRKSRRSASNTACVELPSTLNAIRDSKNPAVKLRFSSGQVPDLIQMLKKGL